MKGTVYKSTGSWYSVKSEDDVFYECRIKGKFRIRGIKSTNPIAVGDEVFYDLEKIGDETIGVINNIQNRKNYIVRKSVNLSKQVHVIASNLDQTILMVTLNNPITYPAFIDRFLVTAEAYEVPAVLIFNKMDVYSGQDLEDIIALQKLYESIGYHTLAVSATEQQNLPSLIGLLKNKRTLVSGNSGVGKSTLVNVIAPGLNLKTSKISEQHLQGQHTTTFAEMYDLPFGGQIIDSPGIRGFGVVDMHREELGDYFPEFFQLKGACKFHNCLHLNEPQCAIKEALTTGDISNSRYRSYLQMLEEDVEDNYRREEY